MKKHKKSKSPKRGKKEESLKSVEQKEKTEKKEMQGETIKLEEISDKIDNTKEKSIKEIKEEIVIEVKEEEINAVQVEEKKEKDIIDLIDKIEIQSAIEEIPEKIIVEGSMETFTETVEIAKEIEKVEINTDTKEKKETPLPEISKTEELEDQQPEKKSEMPNTPSKNKKSSKSKEKHPIEKVAPLSIVQESKPSTPKSQPSTPKSDKKKKKQENKDKDNIESPQAKQKTITEKPFNDAKPIEESIEIPDVASEKSIFKEKEIPTTLQSEITPIIEPEKEQIIEFDESKSLSQDLIEKPSTEEVPLTEEILNVTDTGSPVEESSSTSSGKALIIERTVTTVTTTTSMPGSVEVKPPNVKSMKSVEILESIPLPKIVGSKPTELITLRPETVEASLTTRYARVSDDSAVGIPSKEFLDTLVDESNFDYANYINLVEDDQPILFGSVQDRKKDRSGTPLSAKSVENDEREVDDLKKRQGVDAKISQDTLGKAEKGEMMVKEEINIFGETESERVKDSSELVIENEDKSVEEKRETNKTVEELLFTVGKGDVKNAVEELLKAERKAVVVEQKIVDIEKGEAVSVKLEDSKFEEIENKIILNEEKVGDLEKPIEVPVKIETEEVNNKTTIVEEKVIDSEKGVEVPVEIKSITKDVEDKIILPEEKIAEFEKPIEVPIKVNDTKFQTEEIKIKDKVDSEKQERIEIEDSKSIMKDIEDKIDLIEDKLIDIQKQEDVSYVKLENIKSKKIENKPTQDEEKIKEVPINIKDSKSIIEKINNETIIVEEKDLEEKIEIPVEIKSIMEEVENKTTLSEEKVVESEKSFKEVLVKIDYSEAQEEIKVEEKILEKQETIVDKDSKSKMESIEDKTILEEKIVESEKSIEVPVKVKDSKKIEEEVPVEIKDSKSKTKDINPYYFTDLVKPYWFNYRPYIKAEIDFYRHFKIVKY
ncbi:hypothetical protein HZU67_00895 [Apis mellifera carnica]|nr:hypothetical protein HZU67_00895 [Apis mellifera carnica]